MENPNEILKYEKRKGLIMLGVISWGREGVNGFWRGFLFSVDET
jgi:hypothetical protein